MEIKVNEKDVIKAAKQGTYAFTKLFYELIMQGIGGELIEPSFTKLNADQITLLAYMILREEVMEGGFVQLIHNGYGPFIFLNPFAKAMRLWGAKEFSKLVYKGRKLFELHQDALTKDCNDEEFMALFEQFPAFDELDDQFIESEEEITALVAQYIDGHIDSFAKIVKI